MLSSVLLHLAALLRTARPPTVRTVAPRAVLVDSQQMLTAPGEEADADAGPVVELVAPEALADLAAVRWVGVR